MPYSHGWKFDDFHNVFPNVINFSLEMQSIIQKNDFTKMMYSGVSNENVHSIDGFLKEKTNHYN